MYQIGFIRKTTFIFLLLRVLFMYSRCSVFFSHRFFLALSCPSHDTSNVFQFMSFHVGPAFVSLPSISLFHFAQFEHYFVFTSFIYPPPWWNILNLFINLCASLPLSFSPSLTHCCYIFFDRKVVNPNENGIALVNHPDFEYFIMHLSHHNNAYTPGNVYNVHLTQLNFEWEHKIVSLSFALALVLNEIKRSGIRICP